MTTTELQTLTKELKKRAEKNLKEDNNPSYTTKILRFFQITK